VDARLGHSGAPQLGGEAVRERLRTAQVDVALAEVGHGAPQRAGVEAHLVARAEDLDEAPAAPGDLVAHLAAQHEVRPRRSAHEDRDVGGGRELLQQREDGRDPDAGAISSTEPVAAVSAVNTA
jgi:L-ascorbate metabolism protein UlaG (beta-lactamase superfamily)